MLGRCLSIFVLLLVVFASSSNAVKCMKTNRDDCAACTGYICKTPDGKKITGEGCIEDVNETCQLGWDTAKINTIAKEEYKFEKDKYFVFSCQSEGTPCNFGPWLDTKKSQYQKEIKDAGLSDEPEKVECDPKTEVCVDIKIPFSVCTPLNQERLNNISGGLACPDGKSTSTQSIFCQSGGCKCWDTGDKEAACDNNRKLFIYECDAMNDEVRATIKGCSFSSDKKGDNGAETAGYGFTLLMAPLVASFFL